MAESAALAILGFGRFGRALAELAIEAGVPVRVHDPFVAVPAELRAADLPAALAGAGAVVPAVPMSALDGALAVLAPQLGPGHLVIDVASVKAPAVAACRRRLGDAHPWVATHPLFGPASLARGERPLRVVVCPDTPHVGAADRAAALYERLGCRVIAQDSDAHDRLMAETHALAFFVAKALLALRAGEGEAAVPPSFAAMATTIETVRSDAGHLFFPIQHLNPHAPGARERLLDALTRIHRELAAAAAAPGTGGPEAALAIPPAPPPPALQDARARIDALDAQLLALLARRAALARGAAGVKAAGGRPVQDPAREQALLAARREAAAAHELDADAVADVFEAILRFSRHEQRRWLARAAGNAPPPER
jgi:prephenate dehydrogenase